MMEKIDKDKLQAALCLVEDEYIRAAFLYGPLKSRHEAYAVIFEELDEFWDLVRLKNPNISDMKHELAQTAAMAIRGIIDL